MSDNTPFFIIGSGRSGTTLLRLVISGHSRIHIPPETWFLLPLVEQLPLAEPLSPAQVAAALDIILGHHRWADMQMDAGELRAAVAGLYIDQKVVDYIVDLVRATRDPGAVGLSSLKPLVAFGASPRASLALAAAARAQAFLRGRNYVVPEDVKALAPDVLRHRMVLTFEAEAEEMDSDDIIAKVLEAVPVP
jgi:hypothetical protein